MNTPNGNFIEPSIPNNNATITLNIAGVESTMKLVDFINAIQTLLSTPTLQQVTDAGKETSNEIIVQAVTADTVTVTEGVQFENGLLANIAVVGSEAVVQDSAVIITIDGVRYKIASQIEP